MRTGEFDAGAWLLEDVQLRDAGFAHFQAGDCQADADRPSSTLGLFRKVSVGPNASCNALKPSTGS